MRILITGPSGAVGDALARELAGRHELRGLAREPDRVAGGLGLELIRGDALSGAGLEQALDGVEVAYYLIHSMEAAAADGFAQRDRAAADRFAAAAAAAGVRRIVYLGGLRHASEPLSAHLASRGEVERILLAAVPDSVALRASLVVGARSRSFRTVVRLIERLPVMPLPPWRRHRTQPIDERDAIAYLAGAAENPAVGGGAFDIAGPELLSYGEMIERIAASLLLRRPTLRLPLHLDRFSSAFAARVSGEQVELLGPLMGSLHGDLIANDRPARDAFEVPLHSFDAAVEHALREWEELEPLGRAVSTVESSIVIAAPLQRVWDVVVDAHRYGEWVTIHRGLRNVSPGPVREGSQMEQTLHLRGADIHVHWLLVECRAPNYALWRGRGPARTRARIEYSLTAVDGGTRFDYQNEFETPLGALGAFASRHVMGHLAQRETDRSLAALRELLERENP